MTTRYEYRVNVNIYRDSLNDSPEFVTFTHETCEKLDTADLCHFLNFRTIIECEDDLWVSLENIAGFQITGFTSSCFYRK